MTTFLTLARTVYGEARGETLDGKIAVAWTVRNRVERPRWWGKTYNEVCLKPRQFSCWDDHNRLEMMEADAADPVFADCLYAALGAITGHIADPTDASTHYHASSIHPGWARGHTSVATIGGHIFYNDID